MRKFAPQFAGTPWRDGARVLHAYLLPDLTVDQDLAQLVRACREAMKPYPITPLSDGLIHVTVEMVADTTADHITGDDREALTAALRKHLYDAVPFRVLAGSPIANKAGALLDLSPDAPLADLKGRVREAFREARGPETIQHDGGRHHMSLGYSWDTASSDTLQSALRRITPSHAPFHVTCVHLLDVQFRERAHDRGTAAWEISWEPVATIPLGASP
ncbi:hypothetical protein ACGF4C_00630 [Streptomyces sp. NPDC048197]|uniref:hypothetical protein n=1 Tax=Streptomyces sp. NPDC048197 TaxID=3365511 RepID=UPI00371F7BEA